MVAYPHVALSQDIATCVTAQEEKRNDINVVAIGAAMAHRRLDRPGGLASTILFRLAKRV
jgi:hypothetical protein